MKILMICYEHLSAYNGGVVQVIQISTHLRRLGHIISICAPRIGTYKGHEVTITYIPVLNIRGLRPFSFFFLSPFYLISTFSKLKPDVVILFEIPLFIVPLLITKIRKCPLVFFVNGIFREEAKAGGFITKLAELIHRIYIRFSNSIITVTKGIKEFEVQYFGTKPDKIHIIKNGADIRYFRPMDKGQCRKMLLLQVDSRYVGFVGGLFPWHGVDYLIKAAPMILQHMPDTKFLIVGGGREKTNLVSQVKQLGLTDKFIFTGAVPFEKVPLYINAFDLAVAFFKPVRRDPGDPMKLYEYLSCGVPVVVSDVPGYGDFVERVGAGISVDASNAWMLANAIVKLLQHNSLSSIMGKNGREAVVKGHSWKARAKDIERLLQNLVGS